MLDDLTSTAVQVALSGLAMRQRVTANNVANIATPGYQAGKVEFESALAAAVSAGAPQQAQPTTARSLEPSQLNGNNVNLDEETVSNVNTGLSYQLMLHAMDSKFNLIHTAISGS